MIPQELDFCIIDFFKIILSTVEMMLQKMYTDSKLISDLAKVRNVIIDEASLLTEAALFAIIRRFPEVRKGQKLIYFRRKCFHAVGFHFVGRGPHIN